MDFIAILSIFVLACFVGWLLLALAARSLAARFHETDVIDHDHRNPRSVARERCTKALRGRVDAHERLDLRVDEVHAPRGPRFDRLAQPNDLVARDLLCTCHGDNAPRRSASRPYVVVV